MSPDRFIARKLKFQGKLAAVSIAVSFLVIIIAVAVSSGFRQSVRDGIAALTGDIRIAPSTSIVSEGAPVPVHLPSEQAILARKERAAYAHGAKVPSMLKACRQMNAIDMNRSSYRKHHCFRYLGKPSFSKLIPGDIFVGAKHDMSATASTSKNSRADASAGAVGQANSFYPLYRMILINIQIESEYPGR